MSNNLRRAFAAAAFAALGQSFGCNGKIAQCNQVIEKLNAAQNELVKGMGKLDGKDDAKDMADLATMIDRTVKEIQAVGVTDPKLAGLRTDYVKGLDQVATAAKAVAANDPTKLAQATTDVKAGTASLDKTTDAINTYCHAP